MPVAVNNADREAPRSALHLARALIVLSPDIGLQYFKDLAAVVNKGGPPDKAALVAVMDRYGLVPAALR